MFYLFLNLLNLFFTERPERSVTAGSPHTRVNGTPAIPTIPTHPTIALLSDESDSANSREPRVCLTILG